jgi:hypothetical protein
MIRELLEYVQSNRRRLSDMTRRATAGPLLVRFATWIFTITAMALAFPVRGVVSLTGVLGIAMLSVLPPVFPRTRLVSFVMVMTVFGWLASTVVFDTQVTVWRLSLLATLLYLMHTSAALAAVLPYDTVLTTGVLFGWYTRAAIVVAATIAVAMLSALSSGAFGGHTYLAAAIAGALLVSAFAAMLARLASHRR